MRALAAAALLLMTAQAATAQQTPDLRRYGLTREQASRLEAIIDDPATRRVEGDATIARGERVDGNLYLHRGILTVAGTVTGAIVVVDGDVDLESGSDVGGDVSVIGGAVRGAESATLAGTITEFGEGFGLLASATRLHDGRDDWSRRGRWAEDRWDDEHGYDQGFGARFGGARLAVGIGANYNRVEGLPVQIGPDLRTGGDFATRVVALGIWRTDVGPLTNTERMGYAVRVEQFFGRREVFRIGASVRSTIEPIESWNVSNIEASLAAAMLHEDLRDYFEREGWSAYARVSPRRSPLDVVLEYRDERHRSVALRDPWTLFNRDEPWREQPIVGEGRIRTLNMSATWDVRRGRDFPWRGAFLRGTVTHGLDGDLVLPAAESQPGVPLDRRVFESGFTTGLVDLRTYSPTGHGGVIALRGVAGGSIDGRALAPQFQHALGGVGTMPGYALLGADCGARSASVLTGGASTPIVFFPSYGCDRFALLQAEYRGGFDIHIGDDDDDWHSPRFDTGIDWTLFFDVARGWALGDDVTRTGTGMLYDAGAGVVIGGFGVYGAVPLNGDDRGLRVFVRLGPRF